MVGKVKERVGDVHAHFINIHSRDYLNLNAPGLCKSKKKCTHTPFCIFFIYHRGKMKRYNLFYRAIASKERLRARVANGQMSCSTASPLYNFFS